jgi:hypothetical protein
VRVVRKAFPALTASLAIAIAGCGDGDEGGKAKPGANGPAPPTAKQPLEAAAKRLESAVPRADCNELIRVMIHSIERGLTKPGKPPTPDECRLMRREARNELRGYRVTKTREFGVGGYSEGTGALAPRGKTVGVTWLLDSDGSWKAVFDAIFRPQIDQPPRLPEHADANVRAFVTALRAGDCPTVWRGLNVASRFVRGSNGKRDRYCLTLNKVYRDRATAFSQIRADPRAQPKLLGRTRDFSFYSLELSNGRYMALVLTGQVGNVADDELKEHVNPSVLEMLTVRQPRG